MPSESGPPEAFGMDTLTREVRHLKEDLLRSQQALSVTMAARLKGIETGMCRLDERLERIGKQVMADLNSLKDALDAQGQTIQQEAQEVKSQLDQLQATIDELKQNANDPAQVQALTDEIQANTDAIRGIVTGEGPQPVPSPGGRRK